MTLYNKYKVVALALITTVLIPVSSYATWNYTKWVHSLKANKLYFINATPYDIKIVSKKPAPKFHSDWYSLKCNAYSGKKMGSIISPGESFIATLVGDYTFGDEDRKWVSGCELSLEVLDYNYNGDTVSFKIYMSRDHLKSKDTAMSYYAAFPGGDVSSYCNKHWSDADYSCAKQSGMPYFSPNLYLTGGFAKSTSSYDASTTVDDTKHGDYFAVTLGVSAAGFDCNKDGKGNVIKEFKEYIYNPIGQLDDKGDYTSITSCADALEEL